MKPFTSTVFGLLLAAAGGSGVAQARPQYGAAGGESGLVANIITQLTPFVQSTVAEALAARAGGSSSSVQTTTITGSSAGAIGGSSSGFSSFGSSSSVSGGASAGGSRSSLSAAERAALDGRDMFDENPQYTYAYQVANDEKQTYITQTESRDGDAVQGEYSFVDANGSLVTVRYTANDVDGYNETREVQENFVTIKALPATKAVTAVAAPRPAPPRRVAATTSTSSSSFGAASGNSDLVARIISQLTPYIKTTVTETLSARQTSAPAVVAVQTYEAVPAVSYGASSSSGSSVSSSSIESTFGVSGTNNIQVDTPTYQFETEF